MDIRLGRPEDRSGLVEFNRAMALETEGLELPLETVTAGVCSLLQRPQNGFYVVAERAGELVGSLMITTEWSDWRNGDFWWIQSVYVRPEARRRGIYRRLYAFVKARAGEMGGVCGFRLYVEKENARAHATYEALGMREAVYKMYEASAEPTGTPGGS
ncbi:MAG: GNAT family N-acetyltransferase [bacterium]